MDRRIEKMDAMKEWQLRQWCIERVLENSYGFVLEVALEAAEKLYEFVTKKQADAKQEEIEVNIERSVKTITLPRQSRITLVLDE